MSAERDLAGDGLMFGSVHCATCGTPPIADVSMTRNPDGTLTMHWPDEQGDVTLVTRELLEMVVDEHNREVGRRTHIIGPNER